MRKNCQRHLAKTLSILEPTLLITQGKSMHDQTPLGPLLTDRLAIKPNLFEATIPGGTRSIVCASSHPYQVGHQELAWFRIGDDYLEQVVRPTLRCAMRMLSPSS